MCYLVGYFLALECSKLFPYQWMVMGWSLYVILAYERPHRNVLLSNSGGHLGIKARMLQALESGTRSRLSWNKNVSQAGLLPIVILRWKFKSRLTASLYVPSTAVKRFLRGRNDWWVESPGKNCSLLFSQETAISQCPHEAWDLDVSLWLLPGAPFPSWRAQRAAVPRDPRGLRTHGASGSPAGCMFTRKAPELPTWAWTIPLRVSS